ncbi:hypothetical protein KEM48_001195 [Puccinia striiformis f. sp. tritici PST-130]|nr:hypothetical protein KEM48_001195 [Puccinia striiformis f. sp. tritici PST-130]
MFNLFLPLGIVVILPRRPGHHTVVSKSLSGHESRLVLSFSIRTLLRKPRHRLENE